MDMLKCVFKWMEAYDIVRRDDCDGLEVGNTVDEGKAAVIIYRQGRGLRGSQHH